MRGGSDPSGPPARAPADGTPVGGVPVSRRELLRLGFRGAGGLTLAGLVDVPAARAATGSMKLSEVSEFTTSCNFCSCGCGMVATVRDGKLITMEGDVDHI
ncbi:MAG TPA: hypothetical protein VFN45_01365, partial [Myxococcaceae bacterium]|nr:hypothetical protein [Myxococcaceae bacterium]